MSNLAEVLMATMDLCKVDGQSSVQTQKAATPLQAPAVSKTTLGAQLPSLNSLIQRVFQAETPTSQLEIHSSLAAVLVQTCQADVFLPHRKDFQQRFNL